MKPKLSGMQKAMLFPVIQAVLDGGEPWEDKNAHYPASAIIDAILTIKGVKKLNTHTDGFETNGWQWDWWQVFTYNRNTYVLTGSGYQGGHSFEMESENTQQTIKE